MSTVRDLISELQGGLYPGRAEVQIETSDGDMLVVDSASWDNELQVVVIHTSPA